MKCNIAFWDRILRFIIGVLLLFYAIAGGPFWGYFGLYLIFSSAWGLCFIYSLLKIQTSRDEQRSQFYKSPQD
ncbi:MAG: DUF2892 domain-containing protein [Bdellovibrionota bacterium]